MHSNALQPSIYTALPNVLKTPCTLFTTPQHKEAYLLSALTIMSGILHGYHGIYNGSRLYPNLHCYLINPKEQTPTPLLATHKLCEYIAAFSAEFYHNNMEEYPDELKEYEWELEQYYSGRLKKLPIKPDKPKREDLYATGNTPQQAIIRQLCNNDGKLTLYEADGSNISNTYTIGYMPQLLRKSFYNQPFSEYKQGGVVAHTAMSVVLSGSYADVLKVIPDDTLQQFFCFYDMSEGDAYTHPFAQATPYQDVMEQLKNNVIDIYLEVKGLEPRFELSEQQQQTFIDEYQLATCDDDTLLAITTYRITMVLAMLYHFDTHNVLRTPTITCTDEQLQLAIYIARHYEQYRHHTRAYIAEHQTVVPTDNAKALTPEQLQIMGMTEQGMTLRGIAAELWGDEGKFMRVKRILDGMDE